MAPKKATTKKATTKKAPAKKSAVKNVGRRVKERGKDKRFFVREEAQRLANEQVKTVMVHQAELGHGIEEIAKLNKKSKQFLYNHLNSDQKFKEDFYAARDRGKRCKLSEVEDALYRRAVGTTIKKQLAFKSKGEEIKKTTVIEEIPPDPKAAEFILSTQDKERWNPKTIVQHEGQINSEVVIFEIPANNRDTKYRNHEHKKTPAK